MMRDFKLQLNERGEAVIETRGNYCGLVEVSAPAERYRIVCEDSHGRVIAAVNMKQGGVLKEMPAVYDRIRITNENDGNGVVTLVAGVGMYEEGIGGGEFNQQYYLLDAVTHTAAADGEVFVIPANDSRKRLHIQTGEFNESFITMQGGYQLVEASDFDSTIKNAVTLEFNSAGDSITYMEEI
jgi:hypothetical protein